jgi:hypothetical protein
MRPPFFKLELTHNSGRYAYQVLRSGVLPCYNRVMIFRVYLTTSAPSPMAEDLMRAGSQIRSAAFRPPSQFGLLLLFASPGGPSRKHRPR